MLWTSDKDVDVDGTISYMGVNLQNNTSTEGSLFIHLNPLWMRTLD